MAFFFNKDHFPIQAREFLLNLNFDVIVNSTWILTPCLLETLLLSNSSTAPSIDKERRETLSETTGFRETRGSIVNIEGNKRSYLVALQHHAGQPQQQTGQGIALFRWKQSKASPVLQMQTVSPERGWKGKHEQTVSFDQNERAYTSLLSILPKKCGPASFMDVLATSKNRFM